MRNAIYPSFTSHLYRQGGNEIQMPASDLSLNVCGSSFFNESQVCSDHHLGSFAPLSVMEIPQTFNALNLPGWSSDATSAIERTSQLNLSSRSLILDREAVDTENVRKRKMKCESSEKKPSMEEFQKNKAICTEVRRQNIYSLEKPSESREKKAPVKRSQKISDKITVLQKLVSPFGKTDTASVLQEAYSYIKYLQEQIEMLSAPYFTLRPLQPQCTPGSRVDLCSRGLTLVPVSFTQKFTKADHHDRCSSRRPTFGRIY